MKKLALNKETLTRLTPGRLATVQGAMRPVGDSLDCGSNQTCITDYPCNSDLTCDPKCAQPVCTSSMSVSITKPIP